MPGHLAIGRRVVSSTEAEQRLEGSHRGAAAIVSEDVLVEVDGQVRIGDVSVRAVQPGLEVRDRPVRAGQQLLADGRGALGWSKPASRRPL